jgi:hypothetical protein
MKLARMRNVLRSQRGHRFEGNVQLSVWRRLPLPIPQGFSHSPRRAAKAPHRSPKPDAGPSTLAAHGLALRASKPARPTLHHRVALALTAAVDRSRTAELGDELKKTCKSSSGPVTPSASGRPTKKSPGTETGVCWALRDGRLIVRLPAGAQLGERAIIACRSSLPGKADRDGTQVLPVTIDLII